MCLVTDVYRLIRSYPKEELYGTIHQIRRCAISIPSNIAERYGRHATQDDLRFLNISRGSLYELQTQLEISVNLGYMTQEEFSYAFESTREIERMSSALISKISANKITS